MTDSRDMNEQLGEDETARLRDLGARFRALHQRDVAFVMPNPWDVGSARLLQGLGFEALATTSSGHAQALGRMDGEVSLEETLRHCAELAAATTVPISADMEDGYGESPEDVARCVRAVAGTGVVGASIEDFTGDMARPIYSEQLAVERVAAAVEAADAVPFPFQITARAEHLLREGRDLDLVIRRLQAFERVGAPVLYAPGLATLEAVRDVAAAVEAPLNVLATPLAQCSVTEISEAGASRISVGGTMARALAAGVIRMGRALLAEGDLSWMSEAASSSEVKALF